MNNRTCRIKRTGGELADRCEVLLCLNEGKMSISGGGNVDISTNTSHKENPFSCVFIAIPARGRTAMDGLSL
jgi:hypothetical protein